MPGLSFALYLPTAGWYADTARIVELARTAEESGWDGMFFWDHLMLPPRLPVADAWTTVTAVLAGTTRLRSGPVVTPLARRRPWKVAQECATLDLLSHGRLVLGTGLGGATTDPDLTAFGETVAPAVRAARLDEALTIVDGLWTGEEFSFAGQHYRIERAILPQRPWQRPRVPIWLAATWPHRRPLHRAAQWDGVVPMVDDGQGRLRGPAADELRALLGDMPPTADRFDVAVPGQMPADPVKARDVATRYGDAGATWWLEYFDPWRRSPTSLCALARSGPPPRSG